MEWLGIEDSLSILLFLYLFIFIFTFLSLHLSLYFDISAQLISRFIPPQFRQSSNPSTFNPKPFQYSILPQDGQMFPYGYIWLWTPLRSNSSLCYEEQSTGKKKNVFQYNNQYELNEAHKINFVWSHFHINFIDHFITSLSWCEIKLWIS